MQLLLWHPTCWETHGVKLSTAWIFCELQIALTLRCTELDELSFTMKQSNSLYLYVLCILQMWWIHFGHPVVWFLFPRPTTKTGGPPIYFLSSTAYSVYSPLPSVSEDHSPHHEPVDAPYEFKLGLNQHIIQKIACNIKNLSCRDLSIFIRSIFRYSLNLIRRYKRRNYKEQNDLHYTHVFPHV
jgi:hypothetical protein